MTVDVLTALTTFALIFPAELPDKTFIATLVLATRFPRRAVWIGVAAAFAVQTAIAVIAGGLLSLAPERLVLGITFLLFAAGAVVMARGGLASRAKEKETERDEIEQWESAERIADVPARPKTWLVITTSFAVLFAAEWGDLSQILTAGLSARTGSPLSVFLGSWIALITVAALACLLGGFVRDRFPIWRIKLVSAAILAVLAIWTLIEFIGA